jgi:hypothetical protein
LFLVGGLGSNEYLKGFLEEKLDSDIEIRQPQEGYASITFRKVLTAVYRKSAIMRGAVLHKLNLNIVKRREMRISYGWSSEPIFDPAKHPQSQKKLCKLSGEYRVKDMLHWCVKRVKSLLYFAEISSRELKLWTHMLRITIS